VIESAFTLLKIPFWADIPIMRKNDNETIR
jgi:hypothetical protein